MKKYLLTTITACTTLFGVDSQLDLRMDTDPSRLLQKSSLNLMSTTSTSRENFSLLISPELSFMSSGAVDFAITATHRHRISDYALGHHIFYGRTNVGIVWMDHIGTGLDFLTPHMEIKANYYHPLKFGPRRPVYPNRIIDSEVVFKTPYFSIGTGPLYNIDMHAWSIHSRLCIPFKTCSITFGGLCGQAGYSQAFISLSFHLFKPNNDNLLIIPPSHVSKSNTYYESFYTIDQCGNLISRYSGNFDPDVEQVVAVIAARKKYRDQEQIEQGHHD